METRKEQIKRIKTEYNYFFKKFDKDKNKKLVTVLRRVSRNGMSRLIDVYYFTKKGEKFYINPIIEMTGLYKRDKYKTEALKVSGCGMDMGFDVVYNFSQFIYNDGYKIKQEWL